MPSFAPTIRVEVCVPIRYEPAYQDTLTWLIEEFTELRGGCTVKENVGGYYLSRNNEVVDDRVSVVYSDFPMNWNKPVDVAYSRLIEDVYSFFMNLFAILDDLNHDHRTKQNNLFHGRRQ